MKNPGQPALIVLTGLLLSLVIIGSKTLIPFSSKAEQQLSIPETPAQIKAKAPQEPLSEEKLFNLVQTWRMKQGFKQYERNEGLCDYASKRLWEVDFPTRVNTISGSVTSPTWSHDGFEKTSTETKAKYGLGWLGENLSTGFTTEEATLEAWLSSSSHHENLDFDFTMSCIRCKNNTCVQIFAK